MTESQPETSSHRSWLKRGLLGALIVVALGYALRNVIFGTPVEAYQAVRIDLVQTVVASGRIITPQRVSVDSVITGRVLRIPVEEGQVVKRGSVLIELDDRDERAAVVQAQAAVAQAQAKLRQLREVALPAAQQGLIQAQANAINARQQFERNRELKAKGFVSQASADDAQRNLDVAESQLRAARLQVQTNRPGGSDYAMAQTALEQTHASLGVAQARLEETVISANVDGVLIARNVEPGDVVQPGKGLMALAPTGETQIVVQIDEKNLAQLRPGQKAVASADAYPRERFAAELFYVNPGIDALRGAVEVKLRVPDPPEYLRQDMTVSVDIEVARRADAVVVSADAVHDGGGAQPWVLVIEGRRATRRQVKLGLRGDGRVQVLEGVAPGELLIAGTGVPIAVGQRVRAIRASNSSAP